MAYRNSRSPAVQSQSYANFVQPCAACASARLGSISSAFIAAAFAFSGAEMLVRPCIDQLGSDANAPAGTRDGALDDRIDIEFTRDLRKGLVGLSVAHDRSA